MSVGRGDSALRRHAAVEWIDRDTSVTAEAKRRHSHRCHVLLDAGAFSIREDLTLVSLDERIRVTASHAIDIDSIHRRHHRQMFGHEQ